MWENESVDGLLRAWRRSRGEPEDGPDEAEAEPEAAASAAGEEGAQSTSEQQALGEGGAGGNVAGGDQDVHMEE